jgi:hypothetical protein
VRSVPPIVRTASAAVSKASATASRSSVRPRFPAEPESEESFIAVDLVDVEVGGQTRKV